MITETDQLSQVISQAARIWPELAEQRTLLLWKVLELGIEAIELRVSDKTKGRLATAQNLAGSMDGVWPEAWRHELTSDWPK